MAYRLKQDGFTLISSLLRILIIMITLPILIFVLEKFNVESVEETLSAHQLFFMLQNEINLADHVSFENKRLILTVGDDVIMIEQYGGLIRRRVNRTGHEIYFRNIDTLSFERLPFGGKLKIKTLTGEVYERILLANE